MGISDLSNHQPAIRPPLVRLNSSQATLKVSLSEMGFGADVIERAIIESKATTVEQAVEALFRMVQAQDAAHHPPPQVRAPLSFSASIHRSPDFFLPMHYLHCSKQL